MLIGARALDKSASAALSYLILLRFVLMVPISVAGLIIGATRYGGVGKVLQRSAIATSRTTSMRLLARLEMPFKPVGRMVDVKSQEVGRQRAVRWSTVVDVLEDADEFCRGFASRTPRDDREPTAHGRRRPNHARDPDHPHPPQRRHRRSAGASVSRRPRPSDRRSRSSARRCGRSAARRERIYRASLAVADLLAAVLALGVAVGAHGRRQPDTARPARASPVIVVVSKVKGLYDRDDLSSASRRSTRCRSSSSSRRCTRSSSGCSTTSSIAGSLGEHAGARPLGRPLRLRAPSAATPPARSPAGRRARALPLHRRRQRRTRACASKLDGRSTSSSSAACRSSASAPTRRPQARHERAARHVRLHRRAPRHHRAAGAAARGDARPRPRGEAQSASASACSRASSTSSVVGRLGRGRTGMTLLGVRRFGLTSSSRSSSARSTSPARRSLLFAVAPVMAADRPADQARQPRSGALPPERVGRDGERFRICKFRTMVRRRRGAQGRAARRQRGEDGLFKIADDPRITARRPAPAQDVARRAPAAVQRRSRAT